MRLKPFIAVVICLAFLVLTGATLASGPPDTEVPEIGQQDKEDEIKLAASYDDIVKAIKAANSRSGMFVGGGAAAADEAMPMPAAEAEQGATRAGGDDYSRTNVQVEGVDEGDIVKTDGRYIYVLRDNELVILEALGGNTAWRSAVKLFDPTREDAATRYSEYATELYIDGDVAAVVSTFYSYPVYYRDDVIAREKDAEGGVAVSEPETAPSATASSKAAVAPVAPRMDSSETAAVKVAAEILPYPLGKNITKVTLYDISNRSNPVFITALAQDGGLLATRLLDGTLYVVSNYYMYDFKEDAPETFVPSVYKDGEKRLVDAGEIGILPIMPSSQYTSRWTVYVDEEMDFTNYRWHESGMSNSLFVLDENLDVIGSVTNLAKDGQIYSVRFDGPVAYITTFRLVDPLFAVDLTDPAQPRVLSALKIPGFSQYLHVFGENRLFGLGMDADPETGRTTGMKLTMFDTTDKTDVTVRHELLLGDRYSPALYNHKAILISPEKKLIGFPVDNGYAFYSYNDLTGFTRLLQTDSAEWTYNSRGLYIGDYAYIVSSSDVTVFNIQTFTFAGKTVF